MSQKPRTPKTKPKPTPPDGDAIPQAVDAATNRQRDQAAKLLQLRHRTLKGSFADAYVELELLRLENARVNALLTEAQRVIREMSKQLPPEKPAKKA